MDGIVDPSIVDLLLGDPSGRSWLALVGGLLIVAVAVVRFLSEDRFSAQVADWISAVSAVAAGVGAAYMANPTAPWWHGLVIGVLCSVAGRGLLAKLRGLLPEREE